MPAVACKRAKIAQPKRLSSLPGNDIISAIGPRPRLAAARDRVCKLQPREDGMSIKFVAAAAVSAIIAVPGSAGAQVLTEKNISIKMAMTIAETALNDCTPRVSVAILDRAGRMRVFLQGDNASPHNLELARRKAYTALTFRRPSAEWAKRTAEGDVTGQRSLAEVIPLGGGVPIMIGEDAVGAVGLSGAPGGQPKEDRKSTRL